MLLDEENRNALCLYVVGQLNSFFPDRNPVSSKFLASVLPQTLDRVEFCFSHVADRYFFDGKTVFFSHLHGDQYGMFLYYLSNTIYRGGGDPSVCAKLFALNKALHGVDAFYEVELPDVFRWVHPLGTVLGRGTYGEYFLVYQRCGIGATGTFTRPLGSFAPCIRGAAYLEAARWGSL